MLPPLTTPAGVYDDSLCQVEMEDFGKGESTWLNSKVQCNTCPMLLAFLPGRKISSELKTVQMQWQMCGIDRWVENMEIHTLILYFFQNTVRGCSDCWIFPHCNVPLPHTPTHLHVALGFMLANKERLIWDMKIRGSLDYSEHKMVEYRITTWT